ncbi:MAG TPA: pantoate--beta-alanine ligase [Novosphingobium sp.]
MQIIRTTAELRSILDPARCQGKTVGAVGTSGAMHEGHLSLIRRSAAENDINMLFWGGAPSDLGWKTASMSYERDPLRDFPLAEAAGCQLLFAPSASELYKRKPITEVTLPEMSRDVPHLEDPAHLDLIAKVICKIWNRIGPCKMYFGEKDWQQLVMFQRLALDLDFPVEVIGSPTIRDDDGLATSSRNGQLNPEDRVKAPIFYKALLAVDDVAKGGERSVAALETIFRKMIGDVGTIRYFTVVENDAMIPLTEISGPVRVLASLQLGNTRLLDNIGIG